MTAFARFKHSVLFNPKLVLADHMTFSPNFQTAYRTDDEFKRLVRGNLVELAHFETFNNGRASHWSSSGKSGNTYPGPRSEIQSV
jgi:hypothetical protein